jgi:hypothetical protein
MLVRFVRPLSVLVVSLFIAIPAGFADPPRNDDSGPAPAQDEAVSIQPNNPVLTGHRATVQLIASGRDAAGTERDLTRVLEWVCLEPEIAVVSPTGQVTPKADGEATIVAKKGSFEAQIKVKVQGMGATIPVSFRHDVVPALSQAGCNMGACHGTPTGKGGFRLSLRGYLPDDDYRTLTREAAGRRIDPIDPSTSMLLRKPLGEIAHEGGLRLNRNSKIFQYLYDWIAEGAKNDPDAKSAIRLEIAPGSRVLNAPATTQQVTVRVYDQDSDTPRDVTPICYYDTSNPEIASVDADGFVTFKQRGEVAIIAHYLDLVAITRLTHLVEVPGFKPAAIPTENLVDQTVFEKLNRMRIAPSEVASDEEFLRRATLDVIGVLPTTEERAAFLNDQDPQKRAKLVDQLMTRPEFYDFWTLKFADILRSNGRLIQTKGTHIFNRWIRQALETNVPIDEFVRNLLVADGSTFANPAANYYRISRDPESSVETTAQLFLGVRIQCAKCHNHPFEKWTQDDYYGFAAFFSRMKQKKGTLPEEEVVFASTNGEVRQPRTGKVMPPKALGGPVLGKQGDKDDRRVELAKWLTSPENPFFAKSFSNRVWFHLMGRGIVEPVDDFRDSNPASNDELLNQLAADFVKSGYNLKHLIRTITTSQTYQLSAKTNELNKDDSIYFSHANTKLLPAEVLLDAISTLCSSPTQFDGLFKNARATQIPDGKMENPFLKTFGRPARELACECERESDSNLSQALQLIGKLRDDAGRMAAFAKSEASPAQITKDLYLLALTREPSEQEVAIASKHITDAKDRRQAIEDLGWVLINSKEFLFRH